MSLMPIRRVKAAPNKQRTDTDCRAYAAAAANSTLCVCRVGLIVTTRNQ